MSGRFHRLGTQALRRAQQKSSGLTLLLPGYDAVILGGAIYRVRIRRLGTRRRLLRGTVVTAR